MVGATFEGMCYMHGMCFPMLTPMLYISAFFETWRFPAQNIITNCSQCEVPGRTAAGMEPVQKDHATVNFPGCIYLRL